MYCHPVNFLGYKLYTTDLFFGTAARYLELVVDCAADETLEFAKLFMTILSGCFYPPHICILFIAAAQPCSILTNFEKFCRISSTLHRHYMTAPVEL